MGVVEEPSVDTVDFVKEVPTPVEVERDSVETCLVETKKLGPLVVKDNASSPNFEVEVNWNRTQLAPLDSGADVSLISLEFYDELKGCNPDMRLIESHAKLLTVGRGGLKVYGRCWISLRFGQVELTHPVYVCKTDIPLLVGADVLWRLGSLVDLVNGVLWSGHIEPAPFTDDSERNHSVLVSHEENDVEDDVFYYYKRRRIKCDSTH